MAAKHGFGRYAAPAAFLAVATVAIVLIASALHHATRTHTSPADVDTTPAATTTRAKTTTARARRYYTVVAGDTFNVIAGKTGVAVAELERLNPGVSSTSLHIGQKLRVS